MKPITLSDATFEEQVIKSDKLTIVDLWTLWCGPCKMIAPALEQLAEQLTSRVKFTKLNVDENPRTAQKFGITSIPTLLFFKEGKIVDRLVGAVAKSQIEIRVQRLLPAQTFTVGKES